MALGQGVHLHAHLAGAGNGEDGLGLIEHEAVRVVVDKEDAVLAGEGYQLLEHIPACRCSGGHVGIVGPHELDPAEVHGLQLVEVRVPAVLFQKVVLHHLRFAHEGSRCVGGIARVGNQHLVTLVEEREGEKQDAFLGTHERLDLTGGVQLHAIPALVPGGNGMTEFGDAHIALIAVYTGAVRALGQGLNGLGRRRAVGRADTQVDDRVLTPGDTLCRKASDFLVLNGEVVLLYGERSFCWFDDHNADLYSPKICKSSMSGRTAERAWR